MAIASQYVSWNEIQFLLQKPAKLFSRENCPFTYRTLVLRNNRKVAAVNTDSQEQHPRNNMSEDTFNPRFEQSMSIKIRREKNKVFKTVSKEINRSDNWIMGAFVETNTLLLGSTVPMKKRALGVQWSPSLIMSFTVLSFGHKVRLKELSVQVFVNCFTIQRREFFWWKRSKTTIISYS